MFLPQEIALLQLKVTVLSIRQLKGMNPKHEMWDSVKLNSSEYSSLYSSFLLARTRHSDNDRDGQSGRLYEVRTQFTYL